MPFLLTADGVAPRLPDGGAIFSGGATADVVYPDVSVVSTVGFAPSPIADASISVDVLVSGITVSGLAVAVVATANRWALSGFGQVTLTGFSPISSVSDHKNVLPLVSTIAVIGIVPQLYATAHLWVLPATSDLGVSALQPDASATAHQWTRPDIASIEIEAFDPAVASDASISVGAGRSQFVFDGLVPLVARTAHQWLLPDTSETSLVGGDVSVTADASIVLQAGRADLLLEGYLAWVALSDRKWVFPDASENIVSASQPIVLLPKMSAPGLAGILLSGHSSSVVLALRAFPSVSTLSVAGFVPVPLLPVAAGPQRLQITMAGYLPTIDADASVRIAAGDPAFFAISGISPTITADASIVLGPVTSSFVILGMSPSLGMTDRKWVYPATSPHSLSGFVARVVNPQSASPGIGQFTLAGYVPALEITEDQFARIGAAAVSVAGFQIAIVSPQTVWPAVAQHQLTGYAPQGRGGQSVHPEQFEMVVSAYQPEPYATQDQFARLPGGADVVISSDYAFVVLPRVMFPWPATLFLSGHPPLSHAIIPVALMDFVARPGGEMTGIIVKHPWAEVRVAIDWRPYIQRQETEVVNSDWIETTDLGTVLDGAFISNSIASVEIGGGVPASAPVVENRVVFADGSRDVFRVRVQVAGVS